MKGLREPERFEMTKKCIFLLLLFLKCLNLEQASAKRRVEVVESEGGSRPGRGN